MPTAREYASGTKQNLDAMVKAGLNGMTMPRRFGGLNFPITPYTMCAEIVAAADAGFGNIWSLQDCIETLYESVTKTSTAVLYHVSVPEKPCLWT